MKKLLSLDDLYNFYFKQNKSCIFNASETENTIVVHVDENMTFSDAGYDPDEFKLHCHLKACHVGENRNHSNVTEKAMKEAIPSFYNAPILGYIHELENGEFDFASHEFTIDEDGNYEYKEFPVGVIPESCNAKLVYDKENEKNYLEVDGIIYRNYSKAAEILEKKGNSKVSVELAIDKLSYSADTKMLNIESFHFLGITILGKDIQTEQEVQEGMLGSNITIADFSENNNSLIANIEQSKLIETLEKLNTTLSKFDINENSKEGGAEVDQSEIILNEEVTTEEESIETVENIEEETVVENESVEEVTEETTTEETVTSEEEFSEEKPTEVTPEEVVEENFESTKNEETTLTYSISMNDIVKEFSLSMNAKIEALSILVNDTYSEMDNTFYSIEAFDDHVIMIDYWTGRAYKQNYKCKKDKYSLVGDRVNVYAQYLTEDEISALENMKSNYSSIESELSVYKAAEEYADKLTVFDDESYAQFLETDEFKSLMSDETINANTKEQLQNMAELTFAKLVKANGSFAMHESEVKPEKKPSMFAFAKKESTTSFLDGLLNK